MGFSSRCGFSGSESKVSSSSSSSTTCCFQRQKSSTTPAVTDVQNSFNPSSSTYVNDSNDGISHNVLTQKATDRTSELSSSSTTSSYRSTSTLSELSQVDTNEYVSSQKSTVLPSALRSDAWSEPDATEFVVRDVGYIVGRGDRNPKLPSEQSVFRLLTVDIVQCKKPDYDGLCSNPNERIQHALQREQSLHHNELTSYNYVKDDWALPQFIFAVNLCVPTSSKYYNHVVFYYGLDDISLIKDTSTPLGRVAEPFFFGSSDAYRDKTFKLIPRIVEGNYLVRKAVGSKPSVLGKKVKQHYIQNDRYFELIVDIGSDIIANNIVKLAVGYSKTLTVDMMFVLEGHDETMLPERILGGVRMNHIDLKGSDGQRVLASR